MITHEKIVEAINKVAPEYNITKASYFGSYAEGNAKEDSDLDVLVEFIEDTVSLFDIIGVQLALEEELGIPVDVLHAPLPEDAWIEINKEVPVYG